MIKNDLKIFDNKTNQGKIEEEADGDENQDEIVELAINNDAQMLNEFGTAKNSNLYDVILIIKFSKYVINIFYIIWSKGIQGKAVEQFCQQHTQF